MSEQEQVGGAQAPSALVTLRPGPVLHVWDSRGRETARVELTRDAALELLANLAKAIR